MKRVLPLMFAVISAASPAFAQADVPEGGQIRTGEHDGFSRIVLQIDPKTEWSLETGTGSAKVTIPGKPLKFDTTGVFDKIPRTRVTGITTNVDGDGTTVEVSLGCDCRVSTSFVGARYLAIDVADKTAAPPKVVQETPEERDAREQRTVESAQQSLLRQIERAADQGLIKLANPLPQPEQPAEPTTADAPAVPAEAPAPVVAPEASKPTVAPEASTESAAPEPVAEQAQPPAPAPVEETAAPEAPAQIAIRNPDQANSLAGLLDSDQIRATTVFDRDRQAAAARLAKAPPPPECLPDDQFDIAHWADNRPLFDQVPELNAKMLGEFDTPSPDAVADLARLYIRNGFGTEAEGVMRSLNVDFPDRKLLLDFSRAIEGRPIQPGGPLSVQTPCPGRHGLWQAVGGAAPVYNNPDQFTSVQGAFAELPPDLRLMIGPGLMVRLLDAGHPAEARLIYDTIIRPGDEGSVDLTLSEALLTAAEGDPLLGAKALNGLVEENAPNAVDALMRLTRMVIDNDLPMPRNLVIDLRAAAHESRGSAREAALRGLLAEALARSEALDEAISEVRSAEKDLPDSAPAMNMLAVDLMAKADPEKVGGPAYAAVVLAQVDQMGTAPDNDMARVEIARSLLDLSLPDAALQVLEPAAARGMPEARIAAADAHLRLGQGDVALADLTGIDGVKAAELRAKALAQAGNFASAAQELTKAGLNSEAASLAWSSGDWPKAETAAEDPNQKAMATYMANRTGTPVTAAPAPADPAQLSPAQAFNAPLPTLDQPSLDSARRLLETGQQVQGFIQNVLTPAAPTPPAN